MLVLMLKPGSDESPICRHMKTRPYVDVYVARFSGFICFL